MAGFTQGAEFVLIAKTHITHPDSVFGSARSGILTGVGKIGVRINIFHGRIEAGANTNPGLITVQTRGAGDDDKWIDGPQYRASDATGVEEDTTGTDAGGDQSIAVASTTGFLAGQNIYITDSDGVADGEFHKIDRVIAATSIELAEGLVREKLTGDTLFSDAESWSFWFPLESVFEYRVLFSHEGAVGMNVVIHVTGVETTEFGS